MISKAKTIKLPQYCPLSPPKDDGSEKYKPTLKCTPAQLRAAEKIEMDQARPYLQRARAFRELRKALEAGCTLVNGELMPPDYLANSGIGGSA